MSVRRLDTLQPEEFAFSPENIEWAKVQIAKFPEGKQASAVIPLLWRAQEQHDGWLPEPAIRAVAEMLDMAYIRVYEVATFYTMFNLSPVGKYFVQLCGTTPCWLRGADDLKEVCRKMIGPQNTVTDDGLFSWLEVECLGACTNAPMVQINKDFYEDLTADSFEQLLNDLKKGHDVKPGPQNGRQFSCPQGGATTLLDSANGGGEPLEVVVGDVFKPTGLEKARDGQADDLKKVSGVGPKIEGMLNDLGVFHFDQIAKWSEDNVAWVDQYLKFKGRIAREDWIEQAKILAKGGETEFSKSYDAGEAEEDG